MPFNIDPSLIENDEVRLTEDGNGDLAIEHVPSGRTVTVDENIAVSDIAKQTLDATLDANGNDLTNVGSLDTDDLHTKNRESDIIIRKDNGSFRVSGKEGEIGTDGDVLAAIQTAIDGLGVGETDIHLAMHGVFQFPSDANRVEINRDDVAFRGPMSRDLIIKLPDNWDNTVISDGGSSRDNIVFEHLVFDGNRPNQTNGTSAAGAIGIANTTNVTINRCTFQNFQATPVRTGGESSVTHCMFDTAVQESGQSCAFISFIAGDCEASHNWFENCTDNAIYQNDPSSNYRITNNYFKDVNAGAITPPHSVDDVVLANNIFEGDSIIARFNDKGGSFNGYTITGNVLKNVTASSTYAIDVQHIDDAFVNDFVITNNILKCGGMVGGIRVVAGDGVSVTDNIVKESKIHGIYINGCHDVTVRGNLVIDSNADDSNNRVGVVVAGSSADPTRLSKQVHIKDNIIRDTRDTPQQDHAILIQAASTCENIKVIGNECEGADESLYDIDFTVAGLRIRDNDGLRLKNFGEGAITGDGATSSFTLTQHGLDVDPRSDDFDTRVLCTRSTTNARDGPDYRVYPDQSGNIIIDFESAPGASTLGFDWDIESKPTNG